MALGFELVQVIPRTWFEAQHSVLLDKDDVTPGANPCLAIRPLMLSESGNWVKKSLTWRTIDRMARQFDIDPAHQEWFAQLAGLRTRGKTDFTPDGAPYHLGDFRTPLLWDHFTQGKKLGIEFVGINPAMTIRIGHTARAAIAAAAPRPPPSASYRRGRGPGSGRGGPGGRDGMGWDGMGGGRSRLSVN